MSASSARLHAGFRLVLLALGLALVPAAADAQPLDERLWVTDGDVAAMARNGNTLYIGGRFSSAIATGKVIVVR